MIFTLKKKKISTTLILAFLTIATLPIFIHTMPVNAAINTKIVILPVQNTFYANVTLPKSTFVVNVTVVDVTDLQNWQIKLTWDPTLLQYVNVVRPSDHVFSKAGHYVDSEWVPYDMISPPVDSGPGYVIWGATYVNGERGTPDYWTFNGTGTLCRITLRILAPSSYPATCNLTLGGLSVDTFLLNGDVPAHDIAFTVEDGIYTYIDQLAAKLSPTGPVLVDSGGTATFTVTAWNGPLPYKYQWYFRYPNGTETEDTGAENQTSWTTPPITLFGDHRVTVQVTDKASAKVNASAIIRRTGGPVVYIDPPRIIDPSLIAGESFNVTLSIANASTIHSWSAKLLYNRTILMATDVIEGDFLKSVGSTSFDFTIENDYNATHGQVQMSCELTTGEAEGNGELAKITFQVLDLGGSDITVTDVDLRDSLGNPVPCTIQHGYFNNVLLAKLAIDPPEVSGPEYTVGTTFTINVTLDDVEKLKTCLFNLTYVPSILQEINIIIPQVLGQTPVKKLQVDDEAGYIWTNLTYRNGITTHEPVTIMTVEFQILAMGVSPINLTDTQLYDINGQPVTHEVYHGIFIGLIRDVAIISVTPDLNIVYEGWIVNVTVIVKNKGNISETFEVRLYYDSNLGAITTVTDLPPNEETTVYMDWNTTGVPFCHEYAISATAGPVPYEFNLGDNTAEDGTVKIRIMGDCTGDGIVDMKDIGDACAAYGGYPGSPKWNFYADFNRDGRIDLRDIGIVCQNYQRHC